jgi:hypothetical protein
MLLLVAIKKTITSSTSTARGSGTLLEPSPVI